VAEHDWLKQWLVCAFLVAESDEPICIPGQLQKVCSVTIAGTSVVLCCDARQRGLISMLSAGRGCVIMVTDILYQGLICWVPRMLTDAHKGKKRYQNNFHATIQDWRWDSLVTFGHRGWDVGLYFWTRVQELVKGIALHKVFKKVEIKRMLPMWIYNAISFWNDKNYFCGFLAGITAVETNSILSCRCTSPISTWLIAFTHCWMVPSQLHCLSPVTTIYICEMFLCL